MQSEEYIEEFDDRKRYMSEKQAAYCLRHFHDGGCEVCQYDYEIRCDIALARAIAIKCVEMQIPKKVNNCEVIGKWRENPSYLGNCPSCDGSIVSQYRKKWCDKCGQRLMWGEKE